MSADLCSTATDHDDKRSENRHLLLLGEKVALWAKIKPDQDVSVCFYVVFKP